jgi:hypothetical protein
VSDTDYASEDYQFPEFDALRPADAGRLMDDIEREAQAANRRADRLKSRKAQAKALLNQVLEEYEQDSVRFTNAEGRQVQYTPYPFDVFNVDDEDAFKEWAAGEAERYYDETPRLREDVFRDEMRRRVQDGEDLPPGVRRWTDTKLSRSSAVRRKA